MMGQIASLQASDGGYILAGYTSSSDGSSSAWLVKTDSQGQLLWSHVYSGSAFNSVSRTSDGGYVLAAKFPNAFELVKVDSGWSNAVEPNIQYFQLC